MAMLLLLVSACARPRPALSGAAHSAPADPMGEGAAQRRSTVPHGGRWGIYQLNLETQALEMLYSSPGEIGGLRWNAAQDRLLFSLRADGGAAESEEIYTLASDGTDLRRVTDNGFRDLYPAWSPDGQAIAFLSWRASSLGIYLVPAGGGEVRPLNDTLSHEADIDWVGGQIAFTRHSAIWIMQADGSGERRVTNPPKAGEWGRANLPFGDYDPRLSPDGTRLVFERLVHDETVHGGYDFFVIDLTGHNETRLTESGRSQGLASWSPAGDRIVYVVAAIGSSGVYDLYLMDPDGSDDHNITPEFFPPEFLCRWAVFSGDGDSIFFIGEWWS